MKKPGGEKRKNERGTGRMIASGLRRWNPNSHKAKKKKTIKQKARPRDAVFRRWAVEGPARQKNLRR